MVDEKKVAGSVTSGNKTTIALLGLLVVAAFFIGSLWTKVQVLEKGSSAKVKAGAADSGNQGSQAEPASVLDDLPGLAQEIGLDKEKFTSCLNSGKHSQRVEDDYQEGSRAGVTGTPGNILLNVKTGATRLVPGAVPYETLKQAIDEMFGQTDKQTAETPKISEDDHIRGDRNAQIALVEYSDLQCPFCQRFHSTAQQAVDEYKGKVMWVYKHFPLDQLHPKARKAAEGSECAAELGGEEAFWQFIDKIFAGKK